jgi:hypothetical protein
MVWGCHSVICRACGSQFICTDAIYDTCLTCRLKLSEQRKMPGFCCDCGDPLNGAAGPRCSLCLDAISPMPPGARR